MSESKPYDFSLLEKISGGDKSFIIEMITTFLETAPEFLVKIDEYMELKNYTSLSRETHKFLPGVSFLGLKELNKKLAIIEEDTQKLQNLESLPAKLDEAKLDISNSIELFKTDFNL